MLRKVLESNKYRNDVYHEENQYINLIDDILNENSDFIGRNGNTKAVFGSAMHFSLSENSVPFLTTKKLAWKTCLKELLWFISGNTNNKTLKEQNVHIWDANGSRDFLDSRNLVNREEDDLGPIYGFQWRHFNAEYDNANTNYDKKGIDQLQEIIDNLKNEKTRYSRRLILTAWNPCQLNEMALPPCHILCQFNVINNKLSCALYQRSGDVGLGVPFNIASYSLLTYLMAHHCNLEVGEFIYYLGNSHIYEDHVESLKEQLNNSLYKFPKLNIKNKYENINDYKFEDFEIIDYKCNESIKMIMIK
jgi:thymidylate synthase